MINCEALHLQARSAITGRSVLNHNNDLVLCPRASATANQPRISTYAMQINLEALTSLRVTIGHSKAHLLLPILPIPNAQPSWEQELRLELRSTYTTRGTKPILASQRQVKLPTLYLSSPAHTYALILSLNPIAPRL